MSIESGWPEKTLLVYSKLNLSYKYSPNVPDVGDDQQMLGRVILLLLPYSVVGCQATAATRTI